MRRRIRHPIRKRKNLILRQGNKCHWCDCEMNSEIAHPKQATLDHLVPARMGGDGTLNNLVAACRERNERRGRDIELLIVAGSKIRHGHMRRLVA